MRNLWIVQDKPRATWIADLSALSHEPSALVDWLRTVIGAGEENEVYTVRRAPQIGYDRAGNGALKEFLERIYSESRIVDLFDFAASGSRRIDGVWFQSSARVAYYDSNGLRVEADVDDLGELLANLRPADAPEAEPAGLMVRRLPPLEILGAKVDYRNPQGSVWTYTPGRIRVAFRIFSDIWFPWVRGFLEQRVDVHRFYDNRPLAQCHAPRLNRFLALVSETTRACGGTWEIDEEDSRVMSWMLAETGIRLDVEPPGGVMEYRE